jgi:hypothetical protein
MKFGKGTADKAGRAMKNRTADKMGRAMVKKFSMGGAMAGKGAGAAQKGAQRGMPMTNPRYGQSKQEPYQMPQKEVAGMKKGGKVAGSYRKGADGVASKGKTKGKMVKMRYGGEC